MKILLQLFFAFLKVGSFTFGGGLAMLPGIKREAVNVHGWLNEEEIVDCFAVSQALPGVISINASIYVGNRVKGVAGAISAAAGMIMPAFVSILLILVFLKNFENSVYINGAFEGVKAATTGLILVTVFSMGKLILKDGMAVAIALVSFGLVMVFQMSAIWAIVFGGLAGFASIKIKGRRF